MKEYKDFLNEKEKKKRQTSVLLREDLNKRLSGFLEIVANQFAGINKFIVFGSYAEGDFNEFSDLDIYAQGLGSEDYFEVKRLLEDLLDIEVDLHNDGDDVQFIEKIKARGIIVYERKA
ncbi:MAG: nucleotidyltransferase domain-containing protein [Ruminiclostridium sp.]|nr:nucleotidyltransferase domain-containing protein [Ruminiclostridium sp.]